MNNKEKRYTLTHYLFGALPARLGDEMSGQTMLLMGIAVTGTVGISSWLLAGLTFSAAIGGPLLGAVLDRTNHPGRLLALCLGLHAIGISLIALSLGHIPLWISMLIALLAGFFMPAISGGWSSRLTSFIADEQIPRASAIDAATFNIAGLAGPALAGLAAAWLGAPWAVAILVTLLLAALPLAWSLPKRQQAQIHTSSFIQDVVTGFTIIVTNRALLRITLMSAISYLGIGMLWVICPLIGSQLFDNAGYGGLLLSVLSVGALVATILYAKWPTHGSPDTIAFLSTLFLAAAMFLLLFAGNIVIAVAAMLIAGLADGPQLAAVFAVRHREAPERSRSQVFTTGASLKITAAALGVVLAGYLSSSSLQFVIITACIAQLAAAFSFIALSRKK